MFLRLRTVLGVFALVIPAASATCYWPTGNTTYDRDAYEHIPCSNDTTSPLQTICCARNRTNPSGGDKLRGRTADECLPNGICRNQVLNHGTLEVSYWRETCTEQDWKKGLCLDVCADDWTSGNGTTGAIMTPCDGTAGSLKWCCGVDTSCCDNPNLVKTLPFEFRGAIPNTSAASSLPWPTTTSTSSGSPTSVSTSSSNSQGGNDGLSTGAKVGIGIAVGGLALVCLGFILTVKIVRRNRAQNPSPVEMQDAGYAAPSLPADKTVYAHEFDATERRVEMESSPHVPHPTSKASNVELP